MNLPSLFRRDGHEPLRSLVRLQNDFDKLFQELTGAETSLLRAEFVPSCELHEDKSNYVMKFDIPGVKKENVKVELEGNMLTVSADRHSEKKSADNKSHYSEISYGSFQRSWTLPSAVDEKKIDAKFEDGVLTLVMPKTTQSNVKQIAVH